MPRALVCGDIVHQRWLKGAGVSGELVSGALAYWSESSEMRDPMWLDYKSIFH